MISAPNNAQNKSLATLAPPPPGDGGVTVFEKVKTRPGDRRVRTRNMDPSNLDQYTGPWAKYDDEQTVAKPDTVS